MEEIELDWNLIKLILIPQDRLASATALRCLELREKEQLESEDEDDEMNPE